MTERQILFMDPMVSAIRCEVDPKTVTRRVGATWARCKVGDRLWVREAWNVGDWVGGEGGRTWFKATAAIPRARPGDGEEDAVVIYREAGFPALADVPSYRPSIHMPRWACRLLLDVVSVWVENVGDPFLPLSIDDAEAAREGFPDAAAFLAAWEVLHPAYAGPVYRIKFRRVGP